jgi:hypothetical protein
MKRSFRTAGLALVVAVLAVPAGNAQEVAPTGTRDAVQAAQESPAEVQADVGPVIVPEPSEEAMRYYRSGNLLWIVNAVWGLLIPALFLFTGFSARIRDWAQKLGRKWLFVIGIYVTLFLLITFVIDLPLAYYQGFVRQHAYGLSNQTFDKWFGDAVKSLLVGIVIGVMFLWIPYLLLKRSPRRWWLYTGLAMVPFLFLIILVSPIWIEPLCNDFGPM